MPTVDDEIFKSAFADTEREILSEGANFRDLWPDDTEANDAIVDEMSQVEGFDGRPLSNQEVMARNVFGDEIDGVLTDRPLETAEELSALDRVRELEQQLQQEQTAHQALREQFDPELQERRRLGQAALLDANGLVAVDEARANQFLGQLQQIEQSHDQLVHNRINSSFEAAYQEYGQAFKDAYANLAGNHQHPLVRSIAQGVLNSEDPGEALMQASDLLASVATRQQPPFARTRRSSAARPSRAPAGYEEMEEVGSSMGDEDNIFNSAFR